MKLPSTFGRRTKRSALGFTVIEVMIVMVALAMLGGFGLLVGMDFYRSYSFRSERNILVSVLRRARALSLVNMNQSPHGVRIESAGYTIFEGTSFAGSAPALNETISAPPNIVLSSNPALPRDVVFGQLDGSVATPVSIIITDGVRSSTVSVNNEGRINW